MQISDIVSQRIKLSSMEEKNKAKNKLAKLYTQSPQKENTDSFEVNNHNTSSLSQLREIETKFSRNTVTLKGLQQLQSAIEGWETKGIQENDWDKISTELKNIVLSTKDKGENVISYISTPVNDPKSLYALKMNIAGEVHSLSSTLREERKQLASHFIKLENNDSLQSFSPEKAAKQISDMLNPDNSKDLFRQFSNINHLLGIGS